MFLLKQYWNSHFSLDGDGWYFLAEDLFRRKNEDH